MIVPIVDMGVIRIPPELVPQTLDGILIVDINQAGALAHFLTQRSRQLVELQGPLPPGITDRVVTDSYWIITRDAEKLRAWEPPHDCAECRDGIRLALEAIESDPDVTIGVATIYYDEHHHEPKNV